MGARQFKEKSTRGITPALHRFCAFMAQHSPHQIAEITAPKLEAYQSYLLDLETAKRSIRILPWSVDQRR